MAPYRLYPIVVSPSTFSGTVTVVRGFALAASQTGSSPVWAFRCNSNVASRDV